MSQGQKEQQEGWKGLTAITATETALRPDNLIRGEVLAPSGMGGGKFQEVEPDTERFHEHDIDGVL